MTNYDIDITGYPLSKYKSGENMHWINYDSCKTKREAIQEARKILKIKPGMIMGVIGVRVVKIINPDDEAEASDIFYQFKK